jgi:regulator of protease activity HflC (stomatin/prohibitin superfamily)
MGYIVFASIFVLIGLIALAVGLTVRSEPGVRKGALGVVAGMFVLLLVVTGFNSVTSVGARNVGIQTAFGRYQGTLDNGLQIVAPWSEHEDFSTQIQYLDLDGDKNEEGAEVTFAGGGRGVVMATPRWFIDEKEAGQLWKKYKNFDNVRDQLVSSSAKASFRDVVKDYTPNDALVKTSEIAQKVKANLETQLSDDGIKIDSISIRTIRLDARSQQSLDKIVQANNDIERAKAEQLRAKVDAETLKIKEKAGNLTEGGLTDKCLTVMDKWDVKKNGSLPAGFSCNGVGTPFTVTNK